MPTAPVAPDDRDAQPLMRTPRTDALAWMVPSPDSSKAACSARTASGTRSPRMTQEILIGRRRDHLDVDALAAERREHLRGDARMRLHAGADDRDLAHLLVGGDPQAVLGRRAPSSARRAVVQVVARHRERHVRPGVAGDGLVLDDHVDVDVRLGEHRRDLARDARRVGHADERDASLLGRVRDGGDEGLLHGFLRSDHNGTRRVIEARPAVDAHAVVARVLHGAQLQDAGARWPPSRASPRRR